MSLSKAWSADKTKEAEGVWVDLAINDDETTARIRVLRLGQSNKAFSKEYAKLGKKFRTMRGDKDELTNRAMREAFAKTCVVGWENIENLHPQQVAPEGKPPAETKSTYMSYTVDNAVLLFNTLPELFEHIALQAAELETFQTESDDELGNS